jgi:hypothetical protein
MRGEVGFRDAKRLEPISSSAQERQMNDICWGVQCA